uniref:Uncharacterized protein n=1 Tax=Anguilla anguilla TaxID=7936 RepID=A0A0E9Q3K6_ANGAN
MLDAYRQEQGLFHMAGLHTGVIRCLLQK